MNLWKEAKEGRLISPFDRYMELKCRYCIRAPICRKSEMGLILCVVGALFKGQDDEHMLEPEERELLNSLKGEEAKDETA
jgi:hypothetical protein